MGGPAFWPWWALGGLLVIVEAFAPGFMFLWLGIAAGLVGLVLVIWPEPGLSSQLLLYAGLTVACVCGWHWFRRLRPVTSDHPDLNRRGAQYLGRRFSLVAPIVNGRGCIKVGDSSWTVAGPDAPAGRVVEVIGVDGTVLHVRDAALEPEAQEPRAGRGEPTRA